MTLSKMSRKSTYDTAFINLFCEWRVYENSWIRHCWLKKRDWMNEFLLPMINFRDALTVSVPQ